jgi:YkoY family integral membrane protein
MSFLYFDFQIQDLATVGLLVFLEGILSVDNALAIALIARGLPKEMQRKALTYGIAGAIIFRILALFTAEHLMEWVWIKYVGGGYLLFIALKHWLKPDTHGTSASKNYSALSFWKIVALIELTDIAFAADSILAAVAISKKLWVVILGGVLGLVAMRFAATVFIKLLEKFPNFEHVAYLLVFGVGLKLVLDALEIPGVNFHSAQSPAFWIFWAFVVVCLAYGFMRRPKAEVRIPLEALKEEEKQIEKFEK